MKKAVRYNESYSQDLKITVYYDKGGMNYLNGRVEKRGFYMSVQPVTRKQDSPGIQTESFMVFSGLRMFLLEAKRYSDKKFEEALKIAGEQEADLIASVVAKEGLAKKETRPV